MPMHPRLAAAAVLLLSATRGVAAADNLACSGTAMSWYTDMVGETPCQTYQKLRQICNAQYTVGVQNTNTPPDTCSDQVSSCCCNTIAFSLSMLCLNCQQNIGTTTGYDAGAGAYQAYLGTCPGPQNYTLPTDIQKGVCNEKIKIDDDIYTNGWSDGSWFYVYTRDTITKDNIVANNNSFTHCPSTTINTTSSGSKSASATASKSSTASGTAAADNSTHTSKLATGAIAGIAVGAAVVGLLALLALWFFCCFRKRERRHAGVLEEPLGNGVMSERQGGRTSVGVAGDESLAAHGYNYNSDQPTSTTSDFFPGPRSEGGTSVSAPGFAGLGAGYIGTGYAGPYDSQSTGPLSPRRGFHTAGQPSTSSAMSLPTQAEGSASVSGSSGQGVRRPQAGPLPRKRGANVSASGGNPLPTTPGQRAASEEPFLENEPWHEVEEGGDRHQDAGPVSNVSLGRSASGRLPPAYGEQIAYGS
ncbi:hypothetical protein C8R47DRAFT_1323180 [Mycena vitilis]|nr:hypothetical protein C8R47DRAFT_1323180 [Mycena vitilis]